MQYKIRPAQEPDLLAVVKLDGEAFSPYGTAEDPQVFASRLAAFPGGFIVAEDQETIIGYGTAEKWIHEQDPVMNQDPLQTHQPEGKVFCITAMAVHQSYRNQGVGSALLNELVGIAKQNDCVKVILETTHAQDFYLKYGFRVARERTQWEVKLIVMELDL